MKFYAVRRDCFKLTVCQGEGKIHTKLQYMPDVEPLRLECKGARFLPETLEICYKDHNLAEVLNMAVED